MFSYKFDFFSLLNLFCKIRTCASNHILTDHNESLIENEV